MILLRLLGIGAAYGVGFMFIKSLFPEPFVLLILQGGQSSEGDLTTLALVYMGVGLLAGLIAGPIFGGALLLRRTRSEGPGPRFVLSLALGAADGAHLGRTHPHRLRHGHPPERRRPRSSAPHRRRQPPARSATPLRLDHRPRPAAGRPRRSLPRTTCRRRPPTALRRRKTTGTEKLLLGRRLAVSFQRSAVRKGGGEQQPFY